VPESQEESNLPKTQGFDLITHKRDKRGRLVATNHYRLHILNGRRYFERPVNSGNVWDEAGNPSGRFDTKTRTVDEKAPHVEYVAPLTGAESIAKELANTKMREEQLKAELENIKRERAAQKREADVKPSQVSQPKAEAPAPVNALAGEGAPKVQSKFLSSEKKE